MQAPSLDNREAAAGGAAADETPVCRDHAAEVAAETAADGGGTDGSEREAAAEPSVSNCKEDSDSDADAAADAASFGSRSFLAGVPNWHRGLTGSARRR